MQRKYTKKSKEFFKNVREMNGVTERRCTQCGEWKEESTDNFYMRNKSKPEKGFISSCKQCNRARAMQYQKDHYEQQIETITKWQKENRETTLSYMRKFYQNNKEDRREYVKGWINTHPDKAKEYTENRQRKNHDITAEEWKKCKKYFNDSCAYCGLAASEHYLERNNKIKLFDLHKEHVDDKGANDLRNCVPACQSCNSIKNLKTIDEFFKSGIVEEFTKEKYNKIMEWISEDHKRYIEEKLPYIIKRKQNPGKRTYHYQLWTVDELRNMIECIAIANKKKGLLPYIEEYFA